LDIRNARAVPKRIKPCGGVISPASVSLIIRTGGAERPLRHDLHFNEASSFQIGVSPRPADTFYRQARPCLAAIAFDLEPA
jgi:hypothetical protein